MSDVSIPDILNNMIRRMSRSAEQRAWIEVVAWMKEQEKINLTTAEHFIALRGPIPVIDDTDVVAAEDIASDGLTDKHISFGGLETLIDDAVDAVVEDIMDTFDDEDDEMLTPETSEWFNKDDE